MLRSLKWLYPGLRIKRWVLVIYLGVVVSMLGSMFLVFALFQAREDASLFAQAAGVAALAFAIGGAVLFTGVHRLLKSIGGLLHKRGETSKTLVDIAYERRYLARGPKVVALGGGTGLSNLLAGLRSYTADITAVVSVADDGGSSGLLRKEFDILPPGDIRKCLIALADEAPLMEALLRYRFPEQELSGHSFGNLYITALTRLSGDFGEAVRQANRMLSVRGRVLPASLDSIALRAIHHDGSHTIGQRQVSESTLPIDRVELHPNPGPASPDILRAIASADLVTIGPGSLFTSVIPNLLVPGVPQAIANSHAVCVYIANVATTEGETAGLSLADHLAAIERHLPRRIIDCVLVNSGHPDPSAAANLERKGGSRRLLGLEDGLAERSGYHYIREDVIDPINPAWHSPPKLARALMDIVESHRE